MIIPNTIPEICDLIERKTQDIIFWMEKKNKSRKPSLLTMRAMHEQRCREELLDLREALFQARQKAETEKAKAFVASLAGVRKDWENGLFN